MILSRSGVHTCSRVSHRTGHEKVGSSSFSSAAGLSKGCSVWGWAQLGVLAAQISVRPQLGTPKAVSDYC